MIKSQIYKKKNLLSIMFVVSVFIDNDCSLKACPHQATMLPKTATNCCLKRQHCRNTCQSRRFWQQFVAVSGNNLLPFSACLRQLCCLVWTGLNVQRKPARSRPTW